MTFEDSEMASGESILGRDAFSCSSSTYTSQNGLVFCPCPGMQTNDRPQLLGTSQQNSFDDCMEICGVARPPCYGVSFQPANKTCTLLAKGVTSSNLVTNSRYDFAEADAVQLVGYPTQCPYPVLSYQASASGEQFQVFCNRDMG